jgi:hypothetical protein
LAVIRRGLIFGLEQASRKRLVSVVFGGPKSGRTTLFKQLADALWKQHEQQRLAPTDVPCYIPVYLALDRFNSDNTEILCRRLWEEISKTILDPKLYRSQETPPPPPKPKFYRRRDPWSLLRESLATLFIKLPARFGRYVLLLDNTERLGGLERVHQRKQLVDFLGAEDLSAPLGAVLTGDPILCAELSIHKNLTFKQVTLPLLAHDEARELVGQYNIEAALLADLVAASGRHPHVLSLLCAAVQETGHLSAALQKVMPEIEALFVAIMQTLERMQQRAEDGRWYAPALRHRIENNVMRWLIQHPDWHSVADVESKLGEYGHIHRTFSILEGLGVIDSALLRDIPHWRAHFELWNDWYAKR